MVHNTATLWPYKGLNIEKMKRSNKSCVASCVCIEFENENYNQQHTNNKSIAVLTRIAYTSVRKGQVEIMFTNRIASTSRNDT